MTFQPDTPNLSDAILLALFGAGRLRVKGEETQAASRKRTPRKRYPKPVGIDIPPGAVWNTYHGKFTVRVAVEGRMQFVCSCPPTQEGADLAGELVQLARRLRDDGADLAAIRVAVRRGR